MVQIAIALFLIGVALNIWVKWTLGRHRQNQDFAPGTGGQLANHLLTESQMPEFQVEKSELPDHYDPLDKTIRLNIATFEGRDLTSIVIAAHELGVNNDTTRNQNWVSSANPAG